MKELSSDPSGPSSGDRDPVPELRELLGCSVVFIDWPQGVKGTKRKWKHLTVGDMTPEYLAKLVHGNIGVALGEVSDGLCAIDWDRDELAAAFLRLNPQLSGTLQTHGARGCVFWVRFKGNYPKRTTKLKTDSGEDVGEFRSNGSQSIVWGIHPDTKQPYQFVVKQTVMEIEFNSISWPGETNRPALTPSKAEGGDPEEQKVQKPRGTDELKSSGELKKSLLCSSVPLFFCSISTIEDALRISMPSKKQENNALLFKLARAIKALELKGQTFGTPELKTAFDQWYGRARLFLREGQTKEDYWFEFLNACQRAKFPLGGVKLAQAWDKAKSDPLPPEAMTFDNPEMRMLVAFLKQLQTIQGAEPFFITYRDCAALLGHKTHSTVATWLGALTKLNYIRVAHPGNERQATRYFYIWNPGKQQGSV